jgi:hypothetical protein
MPSRAAATADARILVVFFICVSRISYQNVTLKDAE